MNINKEFHSLFYKRELNPLLGKGKSNLFILIIILFITFTVIGFAEGSLRYLERKMKDPYINWVNILPGNRSLYETEDIISDLNSEEVKNKYGINNAIGYNRFQLNFYDYHNILNYYQTGKLDTNKINPIVARTIEAKDPVLHEIFTHNNYFSGEPFSDSLDIALVINKDILTRLNYPINTPFIWMDLPTLDYNTLQQMRVAVPIPIKGVVETLPGLAGMASTAYFLQQRSQRIGQNPFNPYADQRLLIAFTGRAEEADEYTAKLEDYLDSLEDLALHRPFRIWKELRYHSEHAKHYLLFIRLRGMSKHEMDNVFFQIYNSTHLSEYQQQIYRMYDYQSNLGQYHQQLAYDRVSVNFSSLDKLRDFVHMLRTKYNLDLDMAQIESRENYNFVSQLTSIISIVLIGFSILSVLLFVGHLLKKHLDSIKRNLGTFKAFGLSDSLIINIYVRIVLTILGLSALIALTIAAIFGYMGGMRIILFVFGSSFEPGNYFSLNSQYLFIGLFMLIVFSIIVIRFISNRILTQTPGNLIYERK